MANGAWSKEASFDGGKFKARVVYSYSDGSFVWQYQVDVTKKFNSKHYYVVKWMDPNGDWKEYQTPNTHDDDYTSIQRITNRADLRVKVQIGKTKGSSNVELTLDTIKKNYNASKPTQIDVKKINDARYELNISGSGYPGIPITKLTIERSTDDGSYSSVKEIELSSTGKYTKSYTDPDTEAGHKYRWRVKATNRSGDSGYTYSDSQWTTPETSADVDIEEGSGFNTVVWSLTSIAEIDRGIVEGWYVRRSENGGAYQTIGTVQASTSQYNYSYVDYDISSGSTYKYDIQSFGGGGTSHDSQQGGSEITTAPSKPISVKAYKNENDHVVININDSSSNTADEVLIERSIDGGDYSQIAEADFPCDTYTDETAVGSDTLKYRVRNHNSKGYSAYTESNSVLLKSKPNPPSLMTPYNNTIQDVSSQPIRLTWMHNATDGSPQRQAEIKVTVDGVSQTYTATTQSYIEIAGFDINDSVEWTVRTKGSHVDFSNWSEPYTFRVLKKPEILILSPQNDETITTLPIVLEWLYNDLSGELKELGITLIKGNDEVAKYNADPTTSEYSLAGFLFENHSVYGIRVDALSTTGLKASQLISVAIEYEAISLEGGLLPTVVTDEETGYAYITIGRDITLTNKFIFNETIYPENMPFSREENIILDSFGEEYPVPAKIADLKLMYEDENGSHIVDGLAYVDYLLEIEIAGRTYTYNIDGLFVHSNELGEQWALIYGLDESIGEKVWIDDSYRHAIIEDVITEGLQTWIDESGKYVQSEPIPIAEAYLYRVHDKERMLLGSVDEGTQIIDKYAPFNVDYEYELLQLTEDGRISLVTVTVNLPSSESFIYFGNGEIFRGKWNPKVDKDLDRPEMVEKRYSGREYPLVYDSKARAETDSYSCVLVDRKEYVQLLDLMRSGHGRGIWKSVFGDSYDAKFKVRLNTNRYYHNQTWEVSLDITRIEKDGNN